MKDNSRQSQHLAKEIHKSNEHYEQQIANIKASHSRELEQLNNTLDQQRKETDRLCTLIDELNKKLQQRDEDMLRIRGETQSASVKWHELSAKSSRANR
ncbi:unnamed protein product [Sphagnum jensenii]